jgi:hypothetical protein
LARIITEERQSAKIRVNPWLAFLVFGARRRFKLQFEVNGQVYFLNFVEDEARWYVFAPTPAGVRRIPVYVDAPKYEKSGVLQGGRQKIQN